MMFSKDGYLSPLDVMNRICEVGNRFGTCTCSLDQDELRAYALKQFWIFAKAMDHLYLLDAHGNVIRGSVDLAGPLDGDEDAKHGPVLNPFAGVLMDFRHIKYMRLRWWEHVIVYGLILAGSSMILFMLMADLDVPIVYATPFFGILAHLFMLSDRKALKRRADETLGMFRGMAVCFSEQQVSDYLTLNVEEDTANADPRSEVEVKDAIIRLVDSGELVTRARAREAVGAHLSARGFTRAWGLAAMERPTLSTPGRRIGGIKSDYRDSV